MPVPEGSIYACRFTVPADAAPGDEFVFPVERASFVVATGEETDLTGRSSGGRVRVVSERPTLTATSTAVPSPTPTPGACAGDCDGSGEVSLGEAQIAFNIFLGLRSPESCPAADENLDGEVSLGEVQRAFNNFLAGCVRE